MRNWIKRLIYTLIIFILVPSITLLFFIALYSFDHHKIPFIDKDNTTVYINVNNLEDIYNTSHYENLIGSINNSYYYNKLFNIFNNFRFLMSDKTALNLDLFVYPISFQEFNKEGRVLIFDIGSDMLWFDLSLLFYQYFGSDEFKIFPLDNDETKNKIYRLFLSYSHEDNILYVSTINNLLIVSPERNAMSYWLNNFENNKDKNQEFNYNTDEKINIFINPDKISDELLFINSNIYEFFKNWQDRKLIDIDIFLDRSIMYLKAVSKIDYKIKDDVFLTYDNIQDYINVLKNISVNMNGALTTCLSGNSPFCSWFINPLESYRPIDSTNKMYTKGLSNNFIMVDNFYDEKSYFIFKPKLPISFDDETNINILSDSLNVILDNLSDKGFDCLSQYIYGIDKLTGIYKLPYFILNLEFYENLFDNKNTWNNTIIYLLNRKIDIKNMNIPFIASYSIEHLNDILPNKTFLSNLIKNYTYFLYFISIDDLEMTQYFYVI